MRTWAWQHNFDKRQTELFANGELWAIVPMEVGIRNPSVEDRAQFIVDACNAAEEDREPTEVGSLMQAMVAEARKTT